MTKYYNVYHQDNRISDEYITREQAEQHIANLLCRWNQTFNPADFEIREQYCIYAHSDNKEIMRQMLHLEPSKSVIEAWETTLVPAEGEEPKRWWTQEYRFDTPKQRISSCSTSHIALLR
jgi:hypothetical protein